MTAGAGEAPLLLLEDLSFAYPSRPEAPVLRGVSLAAPRGECLGLAGPNGGGKTTLFRCLTGLNKASGGRIYLDGRLIETAEDFRWLRRKVGYVLQNSEDQLIFPTVMEDLVFGPLNLGAEPEEARARAEAVLRELGMSAYAERISWRLSGGEKKMIALASILVMEPELLLLDEPMNELDEKASARAKEAIASLNVARIVVSHDPDFLKELGARILRLENGRLVEGEGAF